MDLQKLVLVAAQELTKHNLVGWTFTFGDSKRRLGVCKYRLKRIELSEFYASHSADEHVMDTLWHEIAHAIVGPGAGHGSEWQTVAIRLGAKPHACDDTGDAVVKPGDWQSVCPSCQQTHHRYKRPPSLSGYQCRCTARSDLTFEYKGDPADKPYVPQTLADGVGWFAQCSACQTIFRRIRRPKPGIWRCRCAQHTDLTWRYGLAPSPP